MDDAIKTLLSLMGLSPAATAITIIALLIAGFFAKRMLDERQRRKVERRDTLRKYLLEQEEALLRAYRLLYEGKDLNTLSPKAFDEIVAQADDTIMGPFTRYRGALPPDVHATIYNDIHSVLAQFKQDPTSPRIIKPEAVRKLWDYRESFLRQIEGAKAVIGAHLRGGLA